MEDKAWALVGVRRRKFPPGINVDASVGQRANGKPENLFSDPENTTPYVAYSSATGAAMTDGAGLGRLPRQDDEVRQTGFFATTVYLRPGGPELIVFTRAVNGPANDAGDDWSLAGIGNRTVEEAQAENVLDVELRAPSRVDPSELESELERLLLQVARDRGYTLDTPIPIGDEIANMSFPVMNSPISGTTLMQLFAATGSGAAFLANFPHPDGGQIATYFLVVGGTKVVFAAADGIGYALKHGLAYLLLKWMGAPIEFLEAEKKKAQPAKAERRAAAVAPIAVPPAAPSVEPNAGTGAPDPGAQNY